MGKTRKDRKDKDYDYHNNSGSKLKKKRKNLNYRNVSSDEVMRDFSEDNIAREDLD